MDAKQEYLKKKRVLFEKQEELCKTQKRINHTIDEIESWYKHQTKLQDELLEYSKGSSSSMFFDECNMELARSYKSAKIKMDELLSKINKQLENNEQEVNDIRIEFEKGDMNQNVSEDGTR
ncbi:hypothetical protein [Ligilactobacillus sp. LYQ60]|uniref:hypothetical protein n=1 Tax=Ligilactobacillus sp. LYQ60 TaxID=3378799 RepID=UPI0038549A47